MGEYDKINKLKTEHKKVLEEKEQQILALNEKVDKLEQENKDLKKKLYDAGQGQGEVNRLNREIHKQNVENKTLQNKVDKLEYKKEIESFSKERQTLIKRINKLSFTNSIYNRIALKFKDGTDNVIQLAYRIKNKNIDDMDYFTYVFRDDIVGLFEKMLYVVVGKKEDSASKYLVKLVNNEYSFGKKYINKIPGLGNKTVLNNMLLLINLQSTGYHGSLTKGKRVVVNSETQETQKYDKFLNLNSGEQLTAIFTLLEFMYLFFTCEDWETNLINLSNFWFKTI